MKPREIVRSAYDQLAPTFGEWCARVEGDPWERFADELAARLGESARVLDLGCGNGAKILRLAKRFDVVGVDISEEQLQLAREAVPQATFVQGDFTKVEVEGPFDAVTAFYSITHVPREEHTRLFEKVARLLRPGGYLLVTLSASGSDDWIGEWLGVEMFFSGFDADTNRRLLREAGFELLLDEVVAMQEPEVEVRFLWVLAQR